MSLAKPIMTVKDSVTFELNEADLTDKKVGEELKTPARDVPYSEGLKWWVAWYPAGVDDEATNHVSLYLHVNKAASAKYKFQVTCSSIEYSGTYDFLEPDGYGPYIFTTHEKLRSLFIDGKLSIVCEASFTFVVSSKCQVPHLVMCCDHVPTDFELVVGANQVQVHKSHLSLMSPVFHAMLTHDTVESRSGKVKIPDFDFETVKTAIDFCYGREVETLSVETVVHVLRFADKYDMKGVTDQLAKIPRFNLSVETFPTIVHYADDCSDPDLFDECCQFFKEHQKLIRGTEAFTNLTPKLVMRLLEKAFDLKTQFDILRHANSNGINFILDPLEQPIIAALSLDTFCDTAKYAWECSRDDLKKACAEFFDGHLDEIGAMKAFIDLSPEVTHGLLKVRFELLYADK